ncbi:nucleoporin [Culex quinquefasciatus]|uniref:Nucleoporin n=1 Tax=Culex quinquefasciatus TaxID=7176 RepID=B0X8J1_CULQU|nr:nucleoporin [Culex quinquefasciatus]|eukprot:XP_001865972.1 nucleoporin [Culex quinquefasciatus]
MSPKFGRTPAGVANVPKWLKRNLNGVQPEIPFRKIRNNFRSGTRSGMNPSCGKPFDWVALRTLPWRNPPEQTPIEDTLLKRRQRMQQLFIFGWGYGGYIVSMMLASDSENVLKCGAAINPIVSFKYYNSFFTERYVIQPADNGRALLDSDLSMKVGNFASKKYLLIHGTADTQVHEQHTAILTKSLIEVGVMFRHQTRFTATDDDDEVEFTPVKEKDSIFSKRFKLFVKTDGNYSDRDIGTLHIKKVDGKVQILVRADTSIGQILLNIILNEAVPVQGMGKNNVIMVCVPTPETKPSVLLPVKNGEDADDLYETLNKYKPK